MFQWVTKGKEIENFISLNAIRKLLGNNKLKQCGQYELFSDYIEKHYSNFGSKKIQFANSVVPLMSEEDCRLMDVQQKITELYRAISGWNE